MSAGRRREASSDTLGGVPHPPRPWRRTEWWSSASGTTTRRRACRWTRCVARKGGQAVWQTPCPEAPPRRLTPDARAPRADAVQHPGHRQELCRHIRGGHHRGAPRGCFAAQLWHCASRLPRAPLPTQVPDFNTMYELYDPCSLMFFFRNKVRAPTHTQGPGLPIPAAPCAVLHLHAGRHTP